MLLLALLPIFSLRCRRQRRRRAPPDRGFRLRLPASRPAHTYRRRQLRAAGWGAARAGPGQSEGDVQAGRRRRRGQAETGVQLRGHGHTRKLLLHRRQPVLGRVRVPRLAPPLRDRESERMERVSSRGQVASVVIRLPVLLLFTREEIPIQDLDFF